MTATEPTTTTPTPEPEKRSALANVTVPDKVEHLSGRRVKLTICGKFFNLRPPTRDEYRVYRIRFNLLAADSREARTKGDVLDQADDTYAMAIEMIRQFTDEPYDIPSEQEPPFLESASFVSGLLNHWSEVPISTP